MAKSSSTIKEQWNVISGDAAQVDHFTSFKEVVSTGNRFIDKVMGGGVLKGKINEFYGKEGCGKTTLALQLAKQFQALGGEVYWITSEVSWDKDRASSLGVDTSKVTVSIPEAIEDGFDFCIYVINQAKQQNKKHTLIVWDGINAATSRKVLETGSFYAGGVAERARLIAEFFRIITVPLAKNDVTFIVNNHVMSAINNGPYGKEFQNPGGNVLKHLVSLRLYLEWKGRKEEHQTVKLVLEKSRNKEPNQKAEVLMHYHLGFSEAYQVVDVGVEEQILRRYRGQVRLIAEERVYATLSDFEQDKDTYERIFQQVFDPFVAKYELT